MSKQRSEFSNNILDASGNNIHVHYGNVYQGAQTSSPIWTDVLRWIAGPEEVVAQRHLQNSLQEKRQENGTGRWFLEGESFGRWRSQPSSLLWLHGKTGCGKSTLCSSAIKQLQNAGAQPSTQAVAYHFFTLTDRRSQSCDNLIRNLVLQLVRHNNHTRECAENHYTIAGEGVQHAENDQLASVLKDLLKLVPLVYIIIDALDECTEQSKACAFIQDVCDWNVASVRILASSNTMQSRQTETTLKRLSTEKVYVTAKSVSQDIESHIRKLDLDQWDSGQRHKIVNHLTSNSEGSFLWAVGQMIAIETCDSEDELDGVLAALPKDLTNTYERTLSKFKTSSEITNLKTLLCWLLYAGRPLRLSELRQTVAVNWLQKPYFDSKKRLNQRPKIIEQCKFLISVDEDLEDSNAFTLTDDETICNIMEGGSMWHKDAVLRLAHSTVVQFLQETDSLSEHSKRFSTALLEGHLSIAQSSLAYILHVDLTAPPTLSLNSTELATNFPLFDYAINRWYEHATKAGPEGVVRLGSLMKATFSTRWEIYRRVTFTNTRTQYNPFPRSQEQISADKNGLHELCNICQTIQIEPLQTSAGFKHRSYNDLALYSSTCNICNMMRHALLEFALSRHSKQFAITTMTDSDAENLKAEIDWRIRKTAGNMTIEIRTEARDPFLLINCSFYLGRLFLFQHPQLPGSTEILGQPTYDFHTWETFRTCTKWLQVCQETHAECELKDSLPLLPRRVIRISENSLHLVEVRSGQRSQYATLTHCWGGSPMISLKEANLESFTTTGLPWDALSAVFQDFVTTARNLCIQYVWIDALCIIQDSAKDWAMHASMMPDTFANATLNVVSGVDDPKIGFLGNFNRRTLPRFSPVCIDDSENLCVGWPGTESYCDPRGINVVRYPDGWRYRSPPHIRAWTLQEIRLARRNLVFQADQWLGGGMDSGAPSTLLNSQLYMQCQREIKWDNGRKRRQEAVDILTDWYDLVEDYSEQRLTYPSDRLPALAALAKKHATINQHCGFYLAGIWSNELLQGLLWRKTSSRTKYHIERDRYVAPSWSWASHDVPIEFLRPGQVAMTATVVDHSIEPDSGDIYSGVSDGRIVLRSNLLFVEPIDGGHWAPWDGDINVLITNEQDQPKSVRIRYTLDSDDTVGPVYALNITRQAALLLRSPGNNSVHWVRIGVMIVARNDLHKWEITAQPHEVTIV